MKKVIKYHSMGYGAGIFASPEFTHQEIVEVKSVEDLDKYIQSKKDDYGHNFKKDKSLGFDYISNQGGVKVEDYKSPVIKKI